MAINTGDPRPSSRCDAHAIISGGHRRSIVPRGVLAWMKIRIDDPHNGCWLPRDWDDRLHVPRYLRQAIPHRRIHHQHYYEWLGARINPNIIQSSKQLIESLRGARRQLQDGTVPPAVIPRTGR
ncbi:AHH domain-containing protein [Marinimicrobium locisalis]|uniref:AHH domain-containing protein n=1 Tax=Marinimicrobium locisalis TaxID=546022 RepID=UPI003D2FC358